MECIGHTTIAERLQVNPWPLPTATSPPPSSVAISTSAGFPIGVRETLRGSSGRMKRLWT
jgi:hypothetical protein